MSPRQRDEPRRGDPPHDGSRRQKAASATADAPQVGTRPNYLAPDYRGSGKLQDMAAIVTGGDSGIGRAVAVLFAREGADVAIIYLPSEQRDADETRDAIEREGRRCLLMPGDVTDFAFCESAVESTRREFGRLDILVNNAAFQEHASSIDELSLEHFDRTIKTNLYGYFHMAKAAVPHLERGSAIINTGSVTGFEGSANFSIIRRPEARYML